MSHSLACVSFLNSKPLIDPLVGNPAVKIHFAVPSHLLDLLEDNIATAGLLSIVDFQLSKTPLLLIPAGMIGCDGPTLTVRIFSRVPPTHIATLHGDTDSHTSIILAQLILRERYKTVPALQPLPHSALSTHYSALDSLVLIGDKVVNDSPDPGEYPFQLDLGEEWKHLTGLPFVFAMWMIRRDAPPADAAAIATLLNDARACGSKITEQLLDRHAAEKRWPRDLARKYFTEYLRYQVTPEARLGLARFFELARTHNLLATPRPIEYFEVPN